MRRWRVAAALAAAVVFLACEGDNLFGPGGALGPPAITSLRFTADSVVAGGTATVHVSAEAEQGVAHIDLLFTGAFQRDTSLAFADLGQVSSTVTLVVPSTLLDMVLTATATAVDAAGLAGEPRSASVRAVGAQFAPSRVPNRHR